MKLFTATSLKAECQNDVIPYGTAPCARTGSF